MSSFRLLAVAAIFASSGCARVPEYQMPQGFSRTYRQALFTADAVAEPTPLGNADSTAFFPGRTVPNLPTESAAAAGYRPAIASAVQKKPIRL